MNLEEKTKPRKFLHHEPIMIWYRRTLTTEGIHIFVTCFISGETSFTYISICKILLYIYGLSNIYVKCNHDCNWKWNSDFERKEREKEHFFSGVLCCKVERLIDLWCCHLINLLLLLLPFFHTHGVHYTHTRIEMKIFNKM